MRKRLMRLAYADLPVLAAKLVVSEVAHPYLNGLGIVSNVLNVGKLMR